MRLQYASMYRTDVALLTLRETYADLAVRGVTPLSLAAEGPSRGDRIRIPSGYWTEQRACTTTGTAYRLHERAWDWWSSIRLPARDGCAIRGGYSGSPIVSRETGLVVGVANTGYVGGRRCIDSACEENRRGRVVMRKRHELRAADVLVARLPRRRPDVRPRRGRLPPREATRLKGPLTR